MSFGLHPVMKVARHNDSDTNPQPGDASRRPAAVKFPMATTVRLTLEDVDRAPGLWDEVADRATRWVATEGVSLRDVCVLVPFAQLLPWARRAFAREGGWMPRVETTTTLAASLGPAPVARPGQITFDATIDALGAAALLRSQAWGAAWARRDPRGFEQAAGALVRTAHELARAAFAV
ncbi:MAG: hypothetical protein KGI87_01545, partial [Burkholderiales bacterium]|nr:hypothetical protein [Burkholderiales bacterium]